MKAHWHGLAGLLLLLMGALRAQQPPDNVLLIILDDVGAERIDAYGLDVVPSGPTPVIDDLARRGVLFRNAYTNPVCSPTRATMLTGRYGFRTGIGRSIPQDASVGVNGPHQLVIDDASLPRLLSATHRTASIGKWHLDSLPPEGVGYAGPIARGFELHAGPFGNLGRYVTQASAYFDFDKLLADASGHEIAPVERYATIDQVDDALAVIEAFGAEPWFVWLAFNAAHTPFHVPPDPLTTLAVSPLSNDSTKHRAMVEAMDTEIGRLLGSIRPAVLARTWVIVIGDNGTSQRALPGIAPAKGSVTEFGVHVPLIVYRDRLPRPGRQVRALVNSVDVHATVLAMAGLPPHPAAVDSVSFLPYLVDPPTPPQRTFAYVEAFHPNGYGPYDRHHRAVRGPRFKLIRRPVQVQFHPELEVQLFDLWEDPFEERPLDLLALNPLQQAAFQRLDGLLGELVLR